MENKGRKSSTELLNALYDYKNLEGLKCEKDILELAEEHMKKDQASIYVLGDDLDKDSDGKGIELLNKFNGDYYVGKYVGVIVVDKREENGENRRYHVKIKSRFDENNEQQNFLNYLFEHLLGGKAHIFKKMMSASPDQSFKFLLFYLFQMELEKAISFGLYKEYKKFERNDSKFKGILDINRHLRDNLMDNGKIAFHVRERSIDNPVNIIILKVYDLIEKYGRSNLFFDSLETKMFIQLLKSKIPNYKNISVAQLINQNKKVTSSLYSKYESVRKIGLAILQNFGINIYDTSSQETKVYGVLINMNFMWEKLVEKKLQQNMRDSMSIDFQNETEYFFNSKKSDGYVKVRPDILIKKDKATKIVLDSKYKKIWEDGVRTPKGRNDRFQILSYMYLFNAEIGGVVYPVKLEDNNEEKAKLEKYRIFKSDKEPNFYFYQIPIQIDGSSKETVDKKINESIEEFIKNIEG